MKRRLTITLIFAATALAISTFVRTPSPTVQERSS
jgi:hypothetical protein